MNKELKSQSLRSLGHTRHGHTSRELNNTKRTPTYESWMCMRNRCTSKSRHNYEKYKAFNIDVCERWNKFDYFLEDMGERPEGMTLERKNNKKGYSPDNCKWATIQEQCDNKRDTRKYEYKGKTQTITELSKEYGINRRTLTSRIIRGWNIERAVAEST